MKLNPNKIWEMVVHSRISKPLPPWARGIERIKRLKLLGIIFRRIHRTVTFMLTFCSTKLVVVDTFEVSEKIFWIP